MGFNPALLLTGLITLGNGGTSGDLSFPSCEVRIIIGPNPWDDYMSWNLTGTQVSQLLPLGAVQ